VTRLTRHEKSQLILETHTLLQSRIVRALQQVSKPLGGKHALADVPCGQMQAIIALCRIEPCGLSDLAEALAVSRSSASLMVNRLVERGLVVRRPDPSDRRRITLQVASDVRASLDATRDGLQQWLGDAIRPLGVGFLDDWVAVMTRLRPALEAWG